LNGVIAGPVQQRLVVGVAVRAHRCRVFRTMRVLEDCRMLSSQRARRLLRLLVTGLGVLVVPVDVATDCQDKLLDVLEDAAPNALVGQDRGRIARSYCANLRRLR
jgi:hypothetical protein